MPVAATYCRGQFGLHAPLVQVEVNLGSGLPMFSIVGLPAAVVRESKDRVRAALTNCGFEFPAGRVTVNLAPADLPKEGGRFDLPIALGILLASGQLSRARASKQEFYGELGLTGELKPVKGLLLAAASAAEAGHELIVPMANAGEALQATPAGVRAASHLLQVCAHVRGETILPRFGSPIGVSVRPEARPANLADVRGQATAKRALAIAAAGSHGLLLVGPPGAGKSMLAQRLPRLLPPLTQSEALEVAMIASVSAAGFDARTFGVRPFRAPHHTASAHAIVGGGPRACPGEASLAHRGVLFMDELPEFDRRVLEALREPLETGTIAIARARVQAQYPAAFQLVAAMNPCPCGFLGDSRGDCRCTPAQVQAYRAKISGPLLDRIDLHVEVERVPLRELAAPRVLSEECDDIQKAVLSARERQLRRAGKLNGRLMSAELESSVLAAGARPLLERAFEQLRLTARSYQAVLRVGLTIADLARSDRIEPEHIAEAIQLRRAMASMRP
jgi:magnesium chelatase family protein